MESILLLLDCVAIVMSVLWYARNATRPPGEPVRGALRYREAPRPPAARQTATRPAKPRR